MTSNFKKTLLLGTALVAVAAVGNSVYAADLTMTSSATWGVTGTRTSATVQTATAGDNVNITTGAATLTITNDGSTGNDTATVFNTFTLGNVTDSGAGVGAIAITTGSANDLTVTIADAVIDGAFAITGDNADNATIATTITDDLVIGTTLSLTTDEASANDDVTLTVTDDLTVGTTTTLTSAAGGGTVGTGADITLDVNGDATLTGVVTATATAEGDVNMRFAGNATFTGGVLLEQTVASSAEGIASITFDGASAQSVTGAIDGATAAEGRVYITNTSSSGVTFNTAIGGGAAIVDRVDVGANGVARFAANVSTTDFDNDGSAYIAVGATLASTTFTGAGAYYIAVNDSNGTLTSADFGNVTSSGAINLAAESVVFDVTGYIPATTSWQTVTAGNVFAGGAGATGPLAAAVSDTSVFYDFETVLDTNNIDVRYRLKDGLALTDVTTTTNNDNVLTVLNAVGGTATGNLQTVLDSVFDSATTSIANQRAEATLPSVDAGAIDTVVDVAAQSVGVTDLRLAALRSGDQTGMVAGELSNGMGVWFQAFGKLADQDARGDVDGYEADTYGAVVGIDSADVMDGATLGLAVSYGVTDVESDNANTTKTDIDSYQVSLYGEQDLGDGAFVNGTLAYGRNSIDQTRHDVGGTTLDADADYDSSQYVATVGIGRTLPLASGMTITPTTGVNFQHVSIDDYTETGAGTANMAVETDSVNILELGVGAEVAFDAIDMDGSAC
jgi:outer membrane autotransporter protein